MNRAALTLAQLGLGLCLTTGVARTATVAYTLDPGTRTQCSSLGSGARIVQQSVPGDAPASRARP